MSAGPLTPRAAYGPMSPDEAAVKLPAHVEPPPVPPAHPLAVYRLGRFIGGASGYSTPERWREPGWAPGVVVVCDDLMAATPQEVDGLLRRLFTAGAETVHFVGVPEVLVVALREVMPYWTPEARLLIDCSPGWEAREAPTRQLPWNLP